MYGGIWREINTGSQLKKTEGLKLEDVIQIYTDGACSRNPGPGGWAYLMRWKGIEKKDSGCERHTTNNRMELRAVIEALKAIKRPVKKIIIYSDSQYVESGINKWLKSWKQRNFINVKNSEMWFELSDLINRKAENVEAVWVKGHSGHSENELVDRMAVKAISRCR